LQRAVKTAAAIAGHHGFSVPVVASLNDLDCGEWQGMTVPEVEAKYPDLYHDWLNTPQKVRLPGGETLDELRARALPFAEEALEQPGNGKIVLVSHRLVHKVLIAGLLGLDNSFMWSFQLDTAGISRFVYRDGRAVLTAHNDTSYLAPLQMAPPADF
jgi:broad specificity phosphatase PhoE